MVGNFEMYNGVKIPMIGFGTWQIPDGDQVITAVLQALESGYTHIDTASAYYNEKGVGTAIKKSQFPREELFITTKLWNTEQGYESTLLSFEKSMQNLQLEYLDLFLIHWPKTYIFGKEYPQRMKDTWRAFEELYKAKKVRAIGVSNFLPHHLETLMQDATILPMVNQLEIHPGYNQSAAVEYCRKQKIVVEAWSPLACGKIFANESPLSDIAHKYSKSIAQIALRWHLQNDFLPLPKTTNAQRIAENIDIFDFELDENEVRFITDLPECNFSGYHPDNTSFLERIG